VVTVPEIVALPVEIERVSTRDVPHVALIVSEPALRVPAPTAIVQVAPVDGLGILIRPVTVRELVPLMTRLLLVAAVNVNVSHSASISTVTVAPLTMVTSSSTPGTTPPTQVALSLQLPLPAVLDIAAAAKYGPMYGPP